MARRQGTIGRTASGAIIALFGALLTAWGADLGAAPPATAPAAAADRTRIADLIGRLGSADFNTREEAQTELVKIGPAAREQVTAALDSNDAEVRQRAKAILDQISRGVVRTDMRWRTPLPGGAAGTPVVAGQTLLVVGETGGLRAIDLKTGKEKWSATTGGRVVGAPAVAADKVVASAQDQQVYAFELETGKLAWKHKAGEAPAPAAPRAVARPGMLQPANAGELPLTAPAVAAGKVFVAAFGQVTALELDSGKLLWQTKVTGSPATPPLATKERVYVGTGDHTVVGLDVGDGKESWQCGVGKGLAGAPVAGSGVLYVRTDSGVACLDVQKKEARWDRDLEGGQAGGPVVLHAAAVPIRGMGMMSGGAGLGDGPGVVLAGDAVYAAEGAKLVALDAAEGKEKWSFEPKPDEDAAAQANPNGVIVAQGLEQIMVGVAGGQVVTRAWRSGGGGTATPPAVVDQVAYFGTGDGLYAVDTRTGLQVWKFPTPKAVAGAPAAADGAIYFGTSNTTVMRRVTRVAGGGGLTITSSSSSGGGPGQEAAVYAVPLKQRGYQTVEQAR